MEKEKKNCMISYVEYKTQTTNIHRHTDTETDWWLPEGSQVGGLVKKAKGLKSTKLVATEQSQRRTSQHTDYSQ